VECKRLIFTYDWIIITSVPLYGVDLTLQGNDRIIFNCKDCGRKEQEVHVDDGWITIKIVMLRHGKIGSAHGKLSFCVKWLNDDSPDFK